MSICPEFTVHDRLPLGTVHKIATPYPVGIDSNITHPESHI